MKSPVTNAPGELLVAILNEPRDYHFARDEHWYRIPVTSVHKFLRDRWPPRRIAFYQTKIFEEERYSVRYFADVLEDIIAFTKGGIMKVVKVSDKVFIGKDIIHVAVFQKNDERTTYNMVYVDSKTGVSFAKRFNVTGITRDKEYDLTKGSEKSRVHYFSANANGEAEVVKVILSPNCSARIKEFDFYFEEQDIKGRGSIGNQVTKYPIKSVKFKEAGNCKYR